MFGRVRLIPWKVILLSIYIIASTIIVTQLYKIRQSENFTLIENASLLVDDKIKGPLEVSEANPRYFSDPDGNIVYLTGSHTWGNLQNSGMMDPPPPFDYDKYLNFLEANHHNFFRLWTWEHARWDVDRDEDFWIAPLPYRRTGPGLALDGKLKFDLTLFDPEYFDRLRQRVIEANSRNIYVSVMLFQGWSLDDRGFGKDNPWNGNPYNPENNVNGINGDPNGDGSGKEVQTLQIPGITKLQEAYVKKVVDTLDDLDNVLYEISNESYSNSQDWQYFMINFIKDYEAGLPKQHPVGMTIEYPNGNNSELFASPADWISPKGIYNLDAPQSSGGTKVILLDTDHLCGICGDRYWVWKGFTRGNNPILMDPYDGKNWGLPPGYDPNDPKWINLRLNLGYTLAYAHRINLKEMKPREDLCSSTFCLANPVAIGAEYLVYLPSGGSVTVDLTASPREFSVEWFDPKTGNTMNGEIISGGGFESFLSPVGFSDDAVLYLYQ